MASKAIGFLNFKFGADLSGFERAMKKAQKKLKKFGKNIQKTGKSLTTGLTLPILALGAASVKAFDEQQKAIAQVEAGLKSTAGTVGFTSKELQKMAADLQKTTLFGDEEILKGATAQLLTFTNITGKEFAKTQKIALDLATRLDGDLKSASIMLGKALNDPVANLSALSRAGIQFSTEQKETIKSLVETNRLADAQTIILAELEKQYGGSAEAAAAAGMGPIKQLQNELSDLSEQIGQRLIPYIKTFVTWIKGLAEKFDGLSESQKDSIVKWGLILAALGPTLIIIGKMATGISALIPIVKSLTAAIAANPSILLAAAFLLAGKAIFDYTTKLYGAEKAKKALLDVEVEAFANAKEEERQLKNKLKIARDVTKSDEERQGAITELNNKLVTLNGTLNLENVAETNVTNAINKHTEAMINQAKIAGIQDLISESYTELMKTSQDASRALDDMGIIEKSNKAMATLIDFVTMPFTGKTAKDVVDKSAKDIVRNYVGGIKEEMEFYQTKLDELLELQGEVEIITPDLGDVGNVIEPIVGKVKDLGDTTKGVTKDTKDLTDETKGLLDELTTIPEVTPAIAKAWDEVFPDESKLGKVDRFFEKIRENMVFMFGDLGELKDKFQLVFDGVLQIFDAFNEKMRIKAENENKIKTEAIDEDYERQKAAIENSVMSEEEKSLKLEALDQKTQDAKLKLEEETEKKLAKIKKREAVRNKALAIVDAIINTATAVTKVLGQAGLLGIPMAAIIGAMGAIQIGIIASTPLPLKEGGIVSGPTQALIGEYPGAGSNPEVVAPLDKLKSMIGGGNQHITVTGKLIGNDIFLSNAKTGVNRLRTV